MCRASVVAVVLLISSTAGVRAQSINASLTGRVTDPSKALVVDAKIAAIRIDSNVRYDATTNGSGQYFLTNLPPSNYRLEVEKTGFVKLIKPGVTLHVQDALQIDFEMKVGSTSDSITVEAGAPLLNTSDATVSALIDNRKV